MAIIHVEFDVEVPLAAATMKEIDEWMMYELHTFNSISTDNPLEQFEVEAVFGTLRIKRR